MDGLENEHCQFVSCGEKGINWFKKAFTVTHKTHEKDKSFKVHLRIKTLSLFTHPHVLPNPFDFHSSVERWIESTFERDLRAFWSSTAPGLRWKRSFWTFCKTSRRKEGHTACGWVNDDIIFVFGQRVPLMLNRSIKRPVFICVIGEFVSGRRTQSGC